LHTVVFPEVAFFQGFDCTTLIVAEVHLSLKISVDISISCSSNILNFLILVKFIWVSIWICYWFQRIDRNSCKRTAELESNEESVWWWWLRSPGRVNVKAVYIHGDGKCTGGVRPALWLKL